MVLSTDWKEASFTDLLKLLTELEIEISILLWTPLGNIFQLIGHNMIGF